MQPYTTVEAIRARLGVERATALLDHNDDGAEDSGTTETGAVSVVDDAISEADDAIEGALGVKYSIPFASLATTPAQVQRLSTAGAIALLYEWLSPAGTDAKLWRERFDKALEQYRSGKWTVVGAALLGSDSDANARAVIVESGGLVFAGKLDDDYSSEGTADRFPL